MKIEGVLFLILFMTIAACKQKPTENPSEAKSSNLERKDVSITQALNHEEAILLDVRTPGEVAEGIIPGAIHIDVKNSNFKSSVDKLDKSKTYMVYCRSGGRSKTASDMMVEMGFRDVNNVLGGYNAYEDSEHYSADKH